MAEKKAAPKKPKVTQVDVLWAFIKHGRWPQSWETVKWAMKKFKNTEELNSWTAANVHKGKLGPTPDWVLKKLRPTMGQAVEYLRVPELAKVYLNGAASGWDAATLKARTEASNWWRTHNSRQRAWLGLSGPERQVIINREANVLSERWFNLYGEYIDPKKFRDDARRVGAGDLSSDQWESAERRTQRFKTRYPGLNFHPDMTPQRYRQIESDYKTVMAQYGVDPENFDNPNDFTNLFRNDMQASELGERMQLWRKVSSIYGPRARAAFMNYAGMQVSDADVYGLMSGTRKDLAEAYNQFTGHNLSLYEASAAVEQAGQAEVAQFKSGGAVDESDEYRKRSQTYA